MGEKKRKNESEDTMRGGRLTRQKGVEGNYLTYIFRIEKQEIIRPYIAS